MTAAAVVSAVRKRLAYLVSGEVPEAKLSGSLKDKVEQLISQLNAIENNLLKNPSININENYIDLEKEAIQIAYDVEDAVESAALRQDDNDFHILHQGKIDKLLELINHAGEEIKETTSNTFNIRQSQLQYMHEWRYSSKTHIVGLDEDSQKLQAVLMNDDYRYQSAVTSICGMGGIGKTTLARKLFDDPSIVNHFEHRAWVHVGHDFQMRDITAALLMYLSPSRYTEEDVDKMEMKQLRAQLYTEQMGRRCLVVLDDVWSAAAWNTIRPAFSFDCGSKVVMTTRIHDVAKQTSGYIHDMKLLSDEESWELLKSIHFGCQEYYLPMEEIGKKIARQCQGLPLSIIVVGGMMSKMEMMNSNLDMVFHVLQEQNNETFGPALDILALSYNHLPYELKPCFLYLGNLSPDQLIPLQKLYLLWSAEGLIYSTSDDDDHVSKRPRMEVAEDYLLSLVSKSLVMVQHKDFSNLESCKLHDLIRDVCISKGAEEGFFGVVDFEQEKHNLSLMRRTAIYMDNYDEYKDGVSLDISSSEKIRSLLFVDRDGSQSKSTWPKEVADLEEFIHVRVLDFDGIDFKLRKLPKGTENLLYLRYLSFRGCYLEEFPSSLTNFPFLETLDLCVVSSCKMTISNILWKFSCLRHLYFPILFQCATTDKLKLDGLTRLEILENFNADICDPDDLSKLENLQIIKGTTSWNDDDSNKILDNERLSTVTRLLECKELRVLDIEGRLGALPNDFIGFGFTEIVFNGSEFSEDPMPILGKLPNLRSLVLCNDAFVGREMVCNESDFVKLKYLKLASLCSLVQWVVEFGSMPRLASLIIEKCEKLGVLPEELMDIATLEEVKIGLMNEEFQEHVRMMAEEQLSFGNDLLNVTFYD